VIVVMAVDVAFDLTDAIRELGNGQRVQGIMSRSTSRRCRREEERGKMERLS
jgi:hypothetical protein